MDKFLYTFYINTKFYFEDYLLLPVLIAILFCFLEITVNYIKDKNSNHFGSYLFERVKNKQNLFKFCFILYISININATVFSRFRLDRIEPLSNIWGGWAIGINKYYFDFSVIWNILIFIPMCTFVFFHDRYIRHKRRTYFQTAIISTTISFLNSLVIENMQIIFRVGTFQISDLFYNTLGGFLGIFVLLILVRLINILIKNTPYLKNRYNIICK